MGWFHRPCINLVIIYVAAGILTSPLHAAPASDLPSDRCILIKVQVADRDDVAALANMGLDIWEYSEGGLIIRVTDGERSRIVESGFTIETITEDVYEYTEKIKREQMSTFAEPTTAKYHSYAEVVDELIALEDSGVAQTYIIGSTHEGRDIWAVKISDNPAEDEDEPGALFFGCQHAREWIAIEVPLYIAQYLTDNYQTDAEVKHLVDNCQIWIVPLVNPDGYEYSRTVDRMWRKNRRDNGDGTFGVDLNRNWGYMWGGSGSSGNTNNEEYRGPGAFSEPETQAMRDLILANDIQIMLDYHNYGQETYYPWGYTQEPCPDDLPMGAMTSKMRELIKQTSGATYTNWWDSPGSYITSGDSCDWGYGELGIYTFGIELPPKSGGFVLAENRILPACEENLPAALYLISLSAENGGIENLTTGATYSSIQFAVNDANEGDEIVIEPGIYQENILFKGKSLILRSKDPNDSSVTTATVIKGISDGSVMTFSRGEDANCVLAGLTINDSHNGIYCSDSSPTIINCVISGNTGSAIELHNGGSPKIKNCEISRNSGTGIEMFVLLSGRHKIYNYPTIANCLIAENQQNGISGGMPTITNCTIVANTGHGVSSLMPTVTNSIIYYNSVDSDVLQIEGDAAIVTYTDVQGGWPGQGNINVDPFFAKVGYWDPNGTPEDVNDDFRVRGDYHLQSQAGRWDPESQTWVVDDVTSPCIDAGDPSSLLGLESMPNGGIINLGAYGGTIEASKSSGTDIELYMSGLNDNAVIYDNALRANEFEAMAEQLT
jgi:carboxypeptidase T